MNFNMLGNQLHIERVGLEDVEPFFDVVAQSWLSAYPSQELGVTKQMIIDYHYTPDGEPIPERLERVRERVVTAGETHQPFLARLGGQVVGVTSPRINEDQTRRVGLLYVIKKFQGSGIGRQLLDTALDWHGDHNVRIQVAEHTHQAIRFYEKNGFNLTKKNFEEQPIVFENGIKIPMLSMIRKA